MTLSPDFNTDAEQCVLGSILLDNRLFDEVVAIVEAKDFALAAHRALYSVIQVMVNAREQIDAVTVATRLESRGALEEVGGLNYIVSLAANTATPKNARAYAQIVREKAVERNLLAAAAKITETIHGHGSAQEKLEKANNILAGVASAKNGQGPSLAKELLDEFVDTLDERFHRDGEMVGLPTGFKELDEITGGLHSGDLVVMAGRPGMGKSTLAQNLAEQSVLSGKTAAFFSLEMSKNQVIDRAVASIGRIPLQQIRTGKVSDDNWLRVTTAVSRLNKSKLLIDDASAPTVTEIGAKCRKIQREHGLDLVIVDYLQLMGGEGENETARITAISRGLKMIAKDLDVPLIAISQLNRSVEQRSVKRPMMADLRSSGSIEQDADLILFIYRDEVYNKNTKYPGVAELIISKHRNGPTGNLGLVFRGDVCRFENYTGELPEEYEEELDRGAQKKGFSFA